MIAGHLPRLGRLMQNHVFVKRVHVDCLGKSKIIELFIEVGVGGAQYRDLNSDLPVCITQILIQTVTDLVGCIAFGATYFKVMCSIY